MLLAPDSFANPGQLQLLSQRLESVACQFLLFQNRFAQEHDTNGTQRCCHQNAEYSHRQNYLATRHPGLQRNSTNCRLYRGFGHVGNHTK